MKFVYTNKNILPWNYYSNHFKPDPKIAGNIYIDGKEWFNSFLPPFFTAIMADQMLLIKDGVDKGNGFNYSKHLSLVGDLFTEKNILSTLLGLKKQLTDFIELDIKLTNTLRKESNLNELLATIHLGINLADELFFPLEGLVTRKRPQYDFICQSISEDHQAEIALKTFNIDSVMLPLAVAANQDANAEVKKACMKVCKLMFCTEPELDQTLKFLEKTFRCKKFMPLPLALNIIEENVAKIDTENSLDEIDRAACILNELIGMITWSKYFPISLNNSKHRNYTWTDIVKDVGLESSLVGSSGSEKHGRLIYFLGKNFNKDNKIKKEILLRSSLLAAQIFTE